MKDVLELIFFALFWVGIFAVVFKMGYLRWVALIGLITILFVEYKRQKTRIFKVEVSYKMKELRSIYFNLFGMAVFAALFDLWFVMGVTLIGAVIIYIIKIYFEHKLQKNEVI